MADQLAAARVQGRPMTWLAAAYALLFSLLLLFLPFHFQASPYRFIYEYLRAFGLLFFLSALCILAGMAEIGFPRWVGRVGNLLLGAGLSGILLLVAVPSSLWSPVLSFGAVAAAVVFSAFFPERDGLILRVLLTSQPPLIGLILTARAIFEPERVPASYLSLGALFLLAGGLQWAARHLLRHRQEGSWLPALFPFLPLAWLTYLWGRAGVWTGAVLYGVLGLTVITWGLSLRRPWQFRIPRFRRRVLALALGCALLPLVAMGAVSVLVVHGLEREGALQNLTVVAAQVDQQMKRQPDAHPSNLIGEMAGGDGVSLMWLPLAETPASWPDTARGALEEQPPAGERRTLAFIRKPELGHTLVVWRPAREAYYQADRLSLSILGATLALAGLAAFASLLVANRLTRQLEEVRSVAVAIGDRNFGARVSGNDLIDDDEIRELGRSVDYMVTTLEAYTEEIQAQNEELQVQREELMAQQEELLAQNETLLEQDRELQKSQARLTEHRSLLEQIATGAPLPDIMQHLAWFAEQWIPNRFCGIHLLDESTLAFRTIAAPSAPAAFWQTVEELTGDPAFIAAGLEISGMEPVVIPDLEADHPWRSLPGATQISGVRSIMATPILGTQGQFIGGVTMFGTEPGNPQPAEIELLKLTARIAGIAVERQRMSDLQVQKLHSLIQNMAEGVVAVNEDQTILLVNPAAADLLGLSGPLAGTPLEESGLPPRLVQMLERTSEPGSRLPERATFSHGPAELEASVSPVRTEYHRHGAIAVLQDVTAQVQFRRLQENFVANVSHELRGPLASLSATLEAFADGVIPEEQRPRYLHAMLEEMARLRRLSYDVVDLTRMDSGLVELNIAPFSLDDLFRSVRERLGPRYAAAQIRLEVVPTRLLVRADYDRVNQIMLNLLENAIRYTPPGGQVTVTASRRGAQVRVSVTDTGEGIPPEDLPYVWERFYKVDKARTRAPGTGTGLGLAIVKQLVTQMEGEVGVESPPGQGASFHFTLPAAHGSQSSAGE